jgi:hypothetical protein
LIDDAAARIYAEAREDEPGLVKRPADIAEGLVAPQMEFHPVQATLCRLANSLGDVVGFVREQPLDAGRQLHHDSEQRQRHRSRRDGDHPAATSR